MSDRFYCDLDVWSLRIIYQTLLSYIQVFIINWNNQPVCILSVCNVHINFCREITIYMTKVVWLPVMCVVHWTCVVLWLCMGFDESQEMFCCLHLHCLKFLTSRLCKLYQVKWLCKIWTVFCLASYLSLSFREKQPIITRLSKHTRYISILVISFSMMNNLR